MRIKISTIIDAAPPAVWDALEDIASHVEWMADAESIEFLTHRTRGVDTTFACITRVGPFRLRDVLTVTEWSPRRAMRIAHEGVVRGSGRFTLARRRGGRTKLTWREQLQFPWWMGGPIGALAAKPVLRHIWKGNLRRLGTRIAAAG